jgi:sugar (pentulose or hexulose) kinase
MEEYLLGVDIGTTGSRALLMDHDGHILVSSIPKRSMDKL